MNTAHDETQDAQILPEKLQSLTTPSLSSAPDSEDVRGFGLPTVSPHASVASLVVSDDNRFALHPVTHTKQTVYMDDNLEADGETGPEMIMKMKEKSIEVLTYLRIPSNLKDGPAKKQTRYLGWLICLEKKAVKLHADKRRNILDKLTNFKEGKVNLLTKLPKKTRWLYSPREITSLTGSLVHFGCLHSHLKPTLIPFYRLLDRYDLSSLNCWRSFRSINIEKNKWLSKSLEIMIVAVTHNKWVPFAEAAASFNKSLQTLSCYADAAGPPSDYNIHSYGMGGICYELDFAWQCKRSIYLPFLTNVHDTQTIDDSIMSDELLAQQFQKWLIATTFPSATRTCFWC